MHPDEIINTPESYWNRGIPTFLLAVIASGIGAYSYFRVQPAIIGNYQKMVQTNLKELRVPSFVDRLASESGSKLENLESLSPSSRRSRLQQTQLCVRRMIAWDNRDDSLRLQSAQLSEEIASTLVLEAKQNLLQATATSSDEPNELISFARSEQQRATDSIRSAIKLKGENESLGKLWLARKRLSESGTIPFPELDDLEKSLSDLVGSTNMNEPNDSKVSLASIATETWVQLIVMKAFLPSSPLKDGDRIQFASIAIKLDLPGDEKSVEVSAHLALAMFAVGEEQASAVAWRGAKRFWELDATNGSDISSIVCAFQCMVMGGNLREAQGFVQERLSVAPAFERQELRLRFAMGCVRLLLADALNAKTDDAALIERLTVCLSIASMLCPELDEVHLIWERLSAKESRFGATSQELLVAMDLVRWIRAKDSIDLPSIGDGFRSVQAYAMVVSKIALRYANENPESSQRSIGLLKKLNEANPEMLAIWSDRALLHLKQQEYEEAANCYEFLEKKLPDNSEIKQARQKVITRMQTKP
jgi:tetratricopeptide (TPR) repeat protein